MSAPVSSARPDAVDEAARRLGSGSGRLEQVLDAVRRAHQAYVDHCPEAPLELASPGRTAAVVADARDLAFDMRRVADAFRQADSSPYAPDHRPLLGNLATAHDLDLSAVVTAHHPSLVGALGGPIRALAARGRAVGGDVVAAMRRGGAAAAMARLADVDRGDLASPVFAAEVLDTLGPDRIRSITEELAPAAVHWRRRTGPLFELARLWTTATHSLDGDRALPRLDSGTLDVLLASAGGRNVLRALTTASGRAPGERYLRHVAPGILWRAADDDASLSPAYLFLRGADRQGDPDLPLIDLLARHPGLAADVLVASRPAPGAGAVDERTTRLLEAGAGAQARTAELLAALLAHDRFDPEHDSRDRTAILRGTYAWVVESGPAAVSEALAQHLAHTLMTDMGFYLGRVDTVERGVPTEFFRAVTEYERPWITALLAFQHHELVTVRETLHSPAEVRAVALVGISRLQESFEAAARETDRPVDSAAGAFGLLAIGADLALGATRSGNPITDRALKEVVTRGLDAWHRSTVPPPDDHAERTRMEREALRRRIWVVIARDPVLATQLEWDVGGPGSSGSGRLGSGIGGVEDLIGLTGHDRDLDELTGWAAAQPEHLRALVEVYLAGAAGAPDR